MNKKNFKCGTVALIGEANVGKSSLVNALVGESVSIVSQKAGTTREGIRGILNGENYQIIFLDTPGMNKAAAKSGLNRFMNKSISHSVAEADVLCFVLDATDICNEYIQKIKNLKGRQPIIVAVNKTDRTSFEKLYPKLALLNELSFVRAIVPVSAKSGANLDALVLEISKAIPNGPAVFSPDDFTDQPLRKMCAEIIRGELIKCLAAEIPHGLAVQIIRWSETGREIEIDAEIYCTKPSHKPIIIGKNGAVLKEVGIAARKQIEALIEKHVRLNTHVVVRENWTDNKALLGDLGYMH